jgi:ABC-type transport system involved in multi-copper enzyme maturation permease subunit
MHAIRAEFIKLKNAPIVPVTFIAFAIAPLMGGVFMLMAKSASPLEQGGPLSTKAAAMNFAADWNFNLGLLSQAIGVGGILIFGFVASWIFGREYSDNTAKDLLALPASRTSIINAKFIAYLCWCMGLTCSNLLIGIVFGAALQLPAVAIGIFAGHLKIYFISALLTVLLGTPVAFFALWGKGYMAPLGAVALTLVFAQVVGAVGLGNYFPWSIPGLYSGAGGSYRDGLTTMSYLIVVFTSIAGYIATTRYWQYADQTK